MLGQLDSGVEGIFPEAYAGPDKEGEQNEVPAAAVPAAEPEPPAAAPVVTAIDNQIYDRY